MKKKLKSFFVLLYKVMFQAYYLMATKIRKQDEKKAVFILSRGKELEGNLYYVYLELTRQLEGVEVHFVTTENKMNLKLLFSEVTKISNARYLILDDYYLPVYLIKPNKRLKVIQLWHAAGAFKKFGYSTVGTKFGPTVEYLKIVPVHANYTNVYVSSKNVVPYYAEAFNMSPENIYPLGIPRTELFYNEDEKRLVIEKILNDHPILNDKKTVNILVAPTYRADGIQRESKHSIVEVLSEMKKYIKNDVNIIFKAHPYMSVEELKPLNGLPNIIVTTNYFINEWMLVADAFITDYSSSIFDFSVLQKPLAHYVPDLDEYDENRGLYEHIEIISDGKVIRDEESLFKWVNQRRQDEYFDTSRMIKYNFDNTQDVPGKIVAHFIS